MMAVLFIIFFDNVRAQYLSTVLLDGSFSTEQRASIGAFNRQTLLLSVTLRPPSANCSLFVQLIGQTGAGYSGRIFPSTISPQIITTATALVSPQVYWFSLSPLVAPSPGISATGFPTPITTLVITPSNNSQCSYIAESLQQ